MAESVSTPNNNIAANLYSVFVSFRGEDVRNTFFSHLQAAFKRKGITTFFDEELNRGHQISPALLQAIERSSVYVVVFSKNYASSKWCLDELLKIVECKNMNNDRKFVLPVFYHVDPSHVRKQTESYAEAFTEHQKTLQQEELQRWRDSLTQIANLSGFDSSNWRRESEMVDKITQEILEILERFTLNDVHGLVGIEDRVERIESCLCAFNDDGVRILGIWGMGGIGKTTVATTLFHKIKNKFDGYCFLENVRENLGKNGCGLPNLRKKLLSQVMQEENLSMDISCTFLRDRLRGRKVLIVLDDIDDMEQLENLAGGRNWFGVGSRIIITTRNRQLLTDQVDKVYDYAKEQLDDVEALLLFSHHAFKTSKPPNDCLELSLKATKYASGIPLALKVLGSYLRKKDEKTWKSALARLEKFSNDKIFERVLKLSFEELNSDEMDILLDVACFFKGENVEYATSVWDACGFFSHDAISVLSDKCLISLSSTFELWMHDLIQEMCKAHVRKENVEPGERSRLWEFEDIFHVFKKNTGTSKIQSIILNLSETNEVLELGEDCFVKMEKLRLLKVFSKDLDKTTTMIRLPCGLTMLPDSLRYLFWDHYPNKFLPSNFDAQNIVELSLRESCIEQLKKEHEMFKDSSLCLKNLIRLDLSGCLALSNLSVNFYNMKHLCELSLKGSDVSNLPSSIENLTGLIKLNLSYCPKLVSLPDSICSLKLLEELDLDECKSLQHLPENIGNLESLSDLFASGTSIKCVPYSIVYLKNIRRLFFCWCTEMKAWTSPPSRMGVQLPPLGGFQCMIQLDLSSCNLVEVPSSLQYMVSLFYLDLSENNFYTLPQTIFNNLSCLRELDLSKNNFHSLPQTIFNNLSCLSGLDLSKNNFHSLPQTIFSNLSSLYELNLSGCTRLRSLPDLPPSLQTLLAARCTSLESISYFETLFMGRRVYYEKKLDFGDCFKLKNQGDNILRTLFQGALLLAKKAQTSYDQDTYYDGLRFKLRVTYPGIEIPEWFSNQTIESNTVTLQLPPHCIDNSLGFVFCFTFSPDKKLYDDVNFHIRLIFQHDGGNSSRSFCLFSGGEPTSVTNKEDHVVLGYISMHELILSNPPWPKNCNQIECLVEFDEHLMDGDPLKVKKCAAGLLNMECDTGPVFTFNSSSICKYRRDLLRYFEGGTICQSNCIQVSLSHREKRKRHEGEDEWQRVYNCWTRD